MGTLKNGNAEVAIDRAHPEDVEGDQEDEGAKSSTSSYESLDSTNNEIVGLPSLIKKKELLN